MQVLIKTQLEDRQKLITEMLAKAEDKLKGFPEGRISIRHVGNKPYYFHIVRGRKDLSLGKDNAELIQELMQKNYLQMVLKSIRQELKVLNSMREQYPETLAEDVYEQLNEERREKVKPVVLPDELYVKRWQERPYKAKPISSDVPVYITMRGERVRSKSEMIIADRLYTSGIPYKYECPIVVGKKVFHPDFTILRVSDRKILYLEHCGKVGDQQYGDDMVERLNDYNLAGIQQGDRLFLTFESANRPLDVRVIDKLINDQFI